MGSQSYYLFCASSLYICDLIKFSQKPDEAGIIISMLFYFEYYLPHKDEILRCPDHPAGKYSSQDANIFLPCSNTHNLSSTTLHLIALGQIKWFKYKLSKYASNGHIIAIWELRENLLGHGIWTGLKRKKKCTEEPGGLQSMGSQRVRHDWVANTKSQTWKFQSLLPGANSSEITDAELQPMKNLDSLVGPEFQGYSKTN